MSITAPDVRFSTYAPVVPTTAFSATFPVFDNDDIVVVHDGVVRTDFAVTATYNQGISTDAQAVFAVGIVGDVKVVGQRKARRTSRFPDAGPLPIRDFNLALDMLEAESQEQERDLSRSLKVPLAGPLSPEQLVTRVTDLRSAAYQEASSFATSLQGAHADEALGILRGLSITTQNAFDVWPGVFDGVTDNTVVSNAFIARINAGNVKAILIPAGACLAGKLNPITASNVVWLPFGEFKSKADSLAAGEGMLTISGNRHQFLSAVTIDGNKAAYSAGVSCQLLDITGAGHSLLGGVALRNSAGRGMTADGLTDFVIARMIVEDNAGLGFQIVRSSDGIICKSQVRRNGCGYGKTKLNAADINHDFVGFGGVLRFRCHDITFIGGDYSMNGRDGLDINQGCYRIKHVSLRAADNDDGGFTIASDNTGSGIPGEGEPNYDISYFDCDTENNYSGGIVAYGPVHGLTVKGGVQRNNNRLAGDLAEATSYYNGVFVTAGSTGVDIDTAAYDNRQERLISAVSGSGTSRTISVPGWKTLKDIYPKVAIYNGTTGAFRGYGKITAEAAGSVTIQTTAQSGVSLSAIVTGDIITQATQHNGILLENDVRGQVRAKGNAPRVGPTPSLQGQVVRLATASNAGGAVLMDGMVGGNAVLNPDFAFDLGNWSFYTSANATRDTVTVKGLASVKLIGTAEENFGEPAMSAGTLKRFDKSKFRFRGWVYSTFPGDAKARVFTNVGPNVFHEWQSSGRGWEQFIVTGGFDGGNALFPRIVAAPGRTVYFGPIFFEPIDETQMRSIVSREY